MQAIRSLIAFFAPATQAVQSPAQQLKTLSEQEMTQVAGGLPIIGPNSFSQPGTQPVVSAVTVSLN